MNKEYSAGAVIYRLEQDNILYLLIYSKRNGIWGFPKGHIEPGESEFDASMREIKEETGLASLTPIEGFRKEDIYEAISNRGPLKGQKIEKHSVYFLYETSQREISLDNDEIGEYRWLRLSDALPLLQFDSLKKTLQEASKFLEDNVDDEDYDAYAEFKTLKEGVDYIDIGGENIDAKERDPKYSNIIRSAEKEAELELAKRGIKPTMGYCHMLWAEQKRILKEKHNVIWRTPGELNPSIIYD